MKRLKAEVGFYVFQAFPDGFRHGFLFLRRVVGAGVQDFSRGIRHMDGGARLGAGRNHNGSVGVRHPDGRRALPSAGHLAHGGHGHLVKVLEAPEHLGRSRRQVHPADDVIHPRIINRGVPQKIIHHLLHVQNALRKAGPCGHSGGTLCSSFKLAARPPSNSGFIAPNRERTLNPLNGASGCQKAI